MNTFIPLLINGYLEVILFNDVDGASIAVVDVLVAEGPHVMNKIHNEINWITKMA